MTMPRELTPRITLLLGRHRTSTASPRGLAAMVDPISGFSGLSDEALEEIQLLYSSGETP